MVLIIVTDCYASERALMWRLGGVAVGGWLILCHAINCTDVTPACGCSRINSMLGRNGCILDSGDSGMKKITVLNLYSQNLKWTRACGLFIKALTIANITANPPSTHQ